MLTTLCVVFHFLKNRTLKLAVGREVVVRYFGFSIKIKNNIYPWLYGFFSICFFSICFVLLAFFPKLNTLDKDFEIIINKIVNAKYTFI